MRLGLSAAAPMPRRRDAGVVGADTTNLTTLPLPLPPTRLRSLPPSYSCGSVPLRLNPVEAGESASEVAPTSAGVVRPIERRRLRSNAEAATAFARACIAATESSTGTPAAEIPATTGHALTSTPVPHRGLTSGDASAPPFPGPIGPTNGESTILGRKPTEASRCWATGHISDETLEERGRATIVRLPGDGALSAVIPAADGAAAATTAAPPSASVIDARRWRLRRWSSAAALSERM
jgi:hypothetical protein